MKHFLIPALLLVMLSSATAQVSEMEKRYYALQDRFEYRDKDVAKDLKNYLVMYPYTTYADEVRFMQGVLLVERGQYKKSLRDLDHVDFKSLSRPHQPQYQFYRGYANLMLQRYKSAVVFFAILAKSDNPYQERGAYYQAYCLYKLGEYDKALPALQSIEGKAKYKQTVPYYITQVYYSMHDNEQVLQRAEKLLREQPDNANNTELHRMLGEIYYQQGDYAKAVSQLKTYESQVKQDETQALVRNDMYLLGMAYYQLQDYPSAVQYLKQVEYAKDSLMESVYMSLGNAYLRQKNIEQAKLNFYAAAQVGITPAMQEEAMYNYLLTTYQSSSALGESVTAFHDYLTTFPNSKYEQKILTLMSDALRRSKNYAAALQTLDSIPNPDASLLETKQYLRYQLGIDAYMQGKMQPAHEWFSEVLAHVGQKAPMYVTDAAYLRAETNYRLQRYEDCQKDLNLFYSRSDAASSPNKAAAKYLSAYNRFAQKQYEAAQKDWETYLQWIPSTDPTYADALNRLGDCSFNQRQFAKAITYYDRAAACRTQVSDYALFQKGYAQGLQHKYADKIATLQGLVNSYPRSDYADDALYEMARAQLQRNNESEAVKAYGQLLAKYPKSSYARKASVEKAMLHRNLNQTDQAIAAFKQTIECYPGTEEAYAALHGLEDIYVETNRVNEFIAYSKGLSKYRMSTSFKEDSLRYTAHYMAAINHYQNKRYDAAMQEYQALAEITGNPYLLEACTRVAEIAYDKHDYSTALTYFHRMANAAERKESLHIARLGILRCNVQLKRADAINEIATQIIDDESSSDQMRLEAKFERAQVLLERKLYGQAIVDLNECAKEVRSASGAQAKYELAWCYYQLGVKDRAEEEIMSFAQMNTQHQYWLAKALILLADIQVDKGDLFQARQYLLTLINNYKQNDDILAIVQSKLEALDELEAAAQAAKAQDIEQEEEEVSE